MLLFHAVVSIALLTVATSLPATIPSHSPQHSTNTTPGQSAVLPPRRKNACYRKRSTDARAECLQPFLDHWYKDYIALGCPSLGLILAHERCKGCPWEDVDPAAPSFNDSLFHAAAPSCRIADHVSVYSTFEHTYNSHHRVGIFAGLISVALSAFGYSSGKRITLRGWRVPESVFLAVLWIVLNTCRLLLIREMDYHLYCESRNAAYANRSTTTVVYATGLFVSMSRCFSLSSPSGGVSRPGRASSWEGYVSDVCAHWYKRAALEKFLMVFAVFLPTAVCATFLMSLLSTIPVGRSAQGNRCFAGEKHFPTAAIQYSTLLLEMVNVVVYALGSAENSKSRGVRYAVLLFLWAGSVATLRLMAMDFYKPMGLSTLIPRVLDGEVSGGTVEISHAMMISTLGVMEPIRTYCAKSQPQVDPET